MDGSYLSSSLAREVPALLRLGTGILHSIENATQFVHGTLPESQHGMLMGYIAMAFDLPERCSIASNLWTVSNGSPDHTFWFA